MSQSKLNRFPEGSIVLQEGELNMEMYKIVHGHAEVYSGYGTDHEVLLGIIGPGACFGEFGLLLKEPAIYTVVAYSEMYAMRVTEGEVGDFVAANHKEIINIMRNMSRTMMVMQKQIRLLSSELEEFKSVKEELEKQTKEMFREYTLGSTDYKIKGKMRYINARHSD